MDFAGQSSSGSPQSLVLIPRRGSRFNNPFACRPAPHVSDYRLPALVYMNMLDADDLRAAVPQAA
jgi:hypothetical protein